MYIVREMEQGANHGLGVRFRSLTPSLLSHPQATSYMYIIHTYIYIYTHMYSSAQQEPGAYTAKMTSLYILVSKTPSESLHKEETMH